MNRHEQPSSNPVSELARRVEQLSQFIEVSESVAAQLDLEPLLQQIVDTARELVEAELGALLVLGEDEQSFQVFKVSGCPHEPGGFLSATSLRGLPCRQGVPLRLADVRSHRRAVGFPAYHPEIGPFLSVPLRRIGTVLRVVFGDEEEVLKLLGRSTAYIERTHLTMRLFNGRLTRKTLAFSKLLEMYRASAILEDLVYNLARPLKTLRLEVNTSSRRWLPRSPAMVAGLTDRIWTVKELLMTVVPPINT
jgi:hypothetical protein